MNYYKYGNYKSQEGSETRLWKCIPNHDGSTMLLTYSLKDGQLLEKDKVTVRNNYLSSYTVDHVSKELVGSKSTFKKVLNNNKCQSCSHKKVR